MVWTRTCSLEPLWTGQPGTIILDISGLTIIDPTYSSSQFICRTVAVWHCLWCTVMEASHLLSFLCRPSAFSSWVLPSLLVILFSSSVWQAYCSYLLCVSLWSSVCCNARRHCRYPWQVNKSQGCDCEMCPTHSTSSLHDPASLSITENTTLRRIPRNQCGYCRPSLRRYRC